MGFPIQYGDGGPTESRRSCRVLTVGVVNQDHVGKNSVVSEDPNLVRQHPRTLHVGREVGHQHQWPATPTESFPHVRGQNGR